MSFKSKEDAIHFAEKQGALNLFFLAKLSLSVYNQLFRMGLLFATTHGEENPTQELFGKLFVQAEQASDSPHEVAMPVHILEIMILCRNPSGSYQAVTNDPMCDSVHTDRRTTYVTAPSESACHRQAPSFSRCDFVLTLEDVGFLANRGHLLPTTFQFDDAYCTKQCSCQSSTSAEARLEAKRETRPRGSKRLLVHIAPLMKVIPGSHLKLCQSLHMCIASPLS